MSAREYCVYNETRENILTPRVTVIDTRLDPLKAVKVLIEGLAPNAETALWLKPLKNVPTVPRLSAYDLVYLDQDGCVVHGVELAPDDEVPHLATDAASALLLPFHTFAISRVQAGDRVILRLADEMHALMAVIAAPVSPDVLKAGGRAAVVVHPEPAALLTALPPLAWLAKSGPRPGAFQPSVPTKAAAAPAPVKKRFKALHSLAHLRIRVQISISTASDAVPTVRTARPVQSRLAATAPEPAVQAAALPSLTQQFLNLGSATFTAVSTSFATGATFMGRETKEFHAAYIKWAETFVFQRGSAGSDALYNLLRIRRHIFNFIFPH